MVTGYWKDTGRLEDMLECNRKVLESVEPSCRGSVDEVSRIIGRVVIEEGASIVRSTVRGPAIIGRGTRIVDSYVGPFTSIYHDCLIDSTELEHSIVLEADHNHRGQPDRGFADRQRGRSVTVDRHAARPPLDAGRPQQGVARLSTSMLDISDHAGTADQPGPTRARTIKQRIGTAISGPIARITSPPDVAGVGALTAATATVYTVFEIEQQRHFQTAGYDLGIFDQAISGYAHLHAPISLMKGVHNGFGTHFSELGDHFSPIIATVAPVYRVFPSAVTLLVVQGLLFAASLPSVWLFSRRALGRPAAYLIAAAYALAWGLQAAMAADFHEIAFAVPLLAIAIERLDAGRLRSAVIAALLLLLVKEDFGLVVAVFGWSSDCARAAGGSPGSWLSSASRRRCLPTGS